MDRNWSFLGLQRPTATLLKHIYNRSNHRQIRFIYNFGYRRELNIDNYMLVSGSSNRAKSWSCEHCKNFIDSKAISICKTCYWAYPEEYSHIAMKEIRILELTWQGDEIEDYENLKSKAREANDELPDFVKNILKKYSNILP